MNILNALQIGWPGYRGCTIKEHLCCLQLCLCSLFKHDRPQVCKIYWCAYEHLILSDKWIHQPWEIFLSRKKQLHCSIVTRDLSSCFFPESYISKRTTSSAWISIAALAFVSVIAVYFYFCSFAILCIGSWHEKACVRLVQIKWYGERIIVFVFESRSDSLHLCGLV